VLILFDFVQVTSDSDPKNPSASEALSSVTELSAAPPSGRKKATKRPATKKSKQNNGNQGWEGVEWMLGGGLYYLGGFRLI